MPNLLCLIPVLLRLQRDLLRRLTGKVLQAVVDGVLPAHDADGKIQFIQNGNNMARCICGRNRRRGDRRILSECLASSFFSPRYCGVGFFMWKKERE